MSEFDEIKQLLKQNLEVSEESLKILKKLHRARKLAVVLKVAYWVILIALVLGAYYYIEPIIGSLKGTFWKLQTDINSLRNLTMPK